MWKLLRYVPAIFGLVFGIALLQAMRKHEQEPGNEIEDNLFSVFPSGIPDAVLKFNHWATPNDAAISIPEHVELKWLGDAVKAVIDSEDIPLHYLRTAFSRVGVRKSSNLYDINVAPSHTASRSKFYIPCGPINTEVVALIHAATYAFSEENKKAMLARKEIMRFKS